MLFGKSLVRSDQEAGRHVLVVDFHLKAFSQERFEQIRQINANSTWEARVLEWDQAIRVWKQRRRQEIS